MKIIFLNHHELFLGHSMKRYANFLSDGMLNRGHCAEIWYPKPYLSNANQPNGIKKWLRYIDQYILFPIWFKIKCKTQPKTTLFVLVDQALGMMMPLLQHKKHVVHCHDFIALKSAQGLIKENPTSWSGKIYQSLILKGFSKAKNFICVSENTQKELVQYLSKNPLLNEQVYNAVDPLFIPGSKPEARRVLGNHLNVTMENGYILHVGGNDFYKNRIGVIEIYIAWRKATEHQLPLIMVGSSPTEAMLILAENSHYKKEIHFLVRIEDQLLLKAYQGASVFIFPSLAEGFGWPIVESTATGCPVITTDEAPMNEVGGTAAVYIKRCPEKVGIKAWAEESAKILENIIQLPYAELEDLKIKSIENAQRFNGDTILDNIESIYERIVNNDTY